MIKKNEECNQFRTPEENYEAAALELAVYRLLQRDVSSVKMSESETIKNEILSESQKIKQPMLNLIDKEIKETNKSSSFKHSVATVLRTAAVVILLLNFSFTIATAASKTLRTTVIEFLTNMNDSFIDIRFSEGNSDVSASQNWQDNICSFSVPEKYILSSYSFENGSSLFIFKNDLDNEITVRISGSNTFERMNTENSKTSHIAIDDIQALAIEQPFGESSLIWTSENKYFTVSGENYSDLLLVAESIIHSEK